MGTMGTCRTAVLSVLFFATTISLSGCSSPGTQTMLPDHHLTDVDTDGLWGPVKSVVTYRVDTSLRWTKQEARDNSLPFLFKIDYDRDGNRTKREWYSGWIDEYVIDEKHQKWSVASFDQSGAFVLKEEYPISTKSKTAAATFSGHIPNVVREESVIYDLLSDPVQWERRKFHTLYRYGHARNEAIVNYGMPIASDCGPVATARIRNYHQSKVFSGRIYGQVGKDSYYRLELIYNKNTNTEVARFYGRYDREGMPIDLLLYTSTGARIAFFGRQYIFDGLGNWISRSVPVDPTSSQSGEEYEEVERRIISYYEE